MKKRLLEKNNKIKITIQGAEKEISEAKHTIEQNKADISSLQKQENELANLLKKYRKQGVGSLAAVERVQKGKTYRFKIDQIEFAIGVLVKYMENNGEKGTFQAFKKYLTTIWSRGMNLEVKRGKIMSLFECYQKLYKESFKFNDPFSGKPLNNIDQNQVKAWLNLANPFTRDAITTYREEGFVRFYLVLFEPTRLSYIQPNHGSLMNQLNDLNETRFKNLLERTKRRSKNTPPREEVKPEALMKILSEELQKELGGITSNDNIIAKLGKLLAKKRVEIRTKTEENDELNKKIEEQQTKINKQKLDPRNRKQPKLETDIAKLQKRSKEFNKQLINIKLKIEAKKAKLSFAKKTESENQEIDKQIMTNTRRIKKLDNEIKRSQTKLDKLKDPAPYIDIPSLKNAKTVTITIPEEPQQSSIQTDIQKK